MKPETAIILAGGLGTRLSPLTETIPKPLLPVKGKPILQHIIENAKMHGIKNIILTIGYKAEQIQAHFGDGSHLGVTISYLIEREPLGTGGAIKKASEGIKTPFLALNGDNLADFNYGEMLQAHQQNNARITMALYPVEDVTQYGIAALEGQRIRKFIEKPKREEAPSNLNNAGAYIIEPGVLDMLPEGKSSMEKDCFEKLASQGEITAFIHHGQWFPTDTYEKYSKACVEFIPQINLQEKKWIIADVDNTICASCRQVSPEMAAQISALISRGYQFAFISGTDAEDLYGMISSQIAETHHLLATTGTKYVKVVPDHAVKQERIVVYSHALSQSEKNEIMGAFEKLIAHFNILPLTRREDQLQDRNCQITLSALGRNAPHHLKESFDPDGSKRKQWVGFIQMHLNENEYDVKIGGTTSIDITKKGMDKEWGIREFAKFNNISLKDILFFGDKLYPGGNDYPAARIVDCIAVENPEDTLRKLKEIG